MSIGSRLARPGPAAVRPHARWHRVAPRLALALVGLLAACAPHVPLRPDEGAGTGDPANPASVQSRRSLPPSAPPDGASPSPSPRPSSPSGAPGSSSSGSSSSSPPASSSSSPVGPPPSPSADASIARGTDTGFQPAACAACHGRDGEGQASGYPALAAQGRRYLAKQLRDYRDGTRTDPVMQPIAASLSDAAIDAAADWYAAQPARAAPAPASGARAMPGLAADGATLAQVGDARRQLVACDNCHGPGGSGLPPSVPRLAGQHESYLRGQLLAWRQGVRRNDAAGAMAAVAAGLDGRDIAAVARWYAARPPVDPQRSSRPSP